jgi:hypothetical protein
MSFLGRCLLVAMLLSVPLSASARGSPTRHTSHDEAPCGWRNGSLPDPGITQNCLADRYRAVHPQPPRTDDLAPPSNSTAPSKPAL